MPVSSRLNGAVLSRRPKSLLLFALAVVLLSCGIEPKPDSPTLFNLDGARVDPFAEPGPVRVFLFFRTDCPISNRFVPEIRRLQEEFGGRGVDFRLVFVDPEQTVAEIRKHLEEFDLEMAVLRDPEHRLVGWSGARITPEAAVFAGPNRLAYRGRIDNRFIDFGKERPEPTERDLREALEALLTSNPVPKPITEAVGCYISDLRNSW